MTYAETRERGHVPTEEDLDPFDWAIQLLKGPDDFWAHVKGTYGFDPFEDGRLEVAEQTVRALTAHMIKNADYDGLKTAMTCAWTVIAAAEKSLDEWESNYATELAIRDAQMRNPCVTCGVLPHEPCQQTGAYGLVILARPHKRRSAA